MASCALASLSKEDAAEALSAFEEHRDQVSPETVRQGRFGLWRGTGDAVHIQEAKRLLDEAVAKAPEEYHESMRTNLRVNRAIMAAWRGQEPGDGSD